MLCEEQNRKRSEGKSLLSGRLDPTPTTGTWLVHRLPGTTLGQKGPQELPLIPEPLLQPILVQLLDLITLPRTTGRLHSLIHNEY